MASQSSSEQRVTPKTRQANYSIKAQRKSSSLPVETVEYLKAWMMSAEHIAHPYPTDQEKAKIMADTGIELKQLTNWFVNNRKRFWKPRVEARLQQQANVAVAVAAVAAVASVVPMTTTMMSHEAQASYLSPPTAISFLTLDNLSAAPQLPSPPPAVSLTSTPVEDDMRKSEKTVSEVTAENIAAYLPVVPSSPHTVSELSSSASDVGSVDSSSLTEQDEAGHSYNKHHNLVSESSDDMDANETMRNPRATTMTRIETVDVHILHPPLSRKEPTIEDVTILPHVPATRILRTFPNCALTYHHSQDRANRKKVRHNGRRCSLHILIPAWVLTL
jgi:2-polyprenyl-3-methyl-5-hydroxy-6-metoxy-1,4-benzoquinol methylase